MNQLIANPIILPKKRTTIFLPSNPQATHPLFPRLELLLCHLSGNPLKSRAFQQLVSTLWSSPGDRQPSNNTNLTSKSGNCTVVRKIDPLQAPVWDGIILLSYLYESGLGYSSINKARSALSSILVLPGNVNFGSYPLVTRFIKGVFELRPSLPKYQDIWDASLVLKENWKFDAIGLKDLSLKLAMLLALTSQRIQTLKALSINCMNLTVSQCIFAVDVLLKTSKPRNPLSPIVISAYPANCYLCPVQHLKSYLEKTSAVRGTYTQLFVATRNLTIQCQPIPLLDGLRMLWQRLE